ncbi:hypothetical protein L6164_011068 [Bauhinia variegata]|uniref:Uncharacterized protein n=1 Tax=Bauhinia variegata TaxID=167791 RepID=A0ACB9P730_BAUVA|nr:hypothetical protein L6164_011068 [Bauhinia variegata]
MNKSSSINSESSTLDSPHRFHSPLQWDQGDPPETPPYHSPENSPDKQTDNSRAIVLVEDSTQYPPARSTFSPPEQRKTPESTPPAKQPSSTMTLNRSAREDPPPSVTKVGPASGGGYRERSRPATSTPGWSKRDEMLRKAALGFRFSELVLCLISFSVMAADKTQGWSGDSFDRYKEYRYCLTVNVIGFVYAGLQACDLATQVVTGKPIINLALRYHFDFFMDQVLAYLLISASSSAATRVDDWQSNWGKDEFTEMASASVGMAFLAFVSFAISSLISGYNLCTHSSL